MNTYSHTSITATNNGYLLGYSSSGKEKDSEKGLSYFGARYYELEMLNVWLSVDPMADKYPNLSPYNYCAWNPIKLVDPDGMEIDDYFDKDGNYLGSDNATTDNIRVISSYTWSQLMMDDNGHVDHNEDYCLSLSFSEASCSGMTEEAQKAVYDHYNHTGFPTKFKENEKGTGGFTSHFEPNTAPIIYIRAKANLTHSSDGTDPECNHAERLKSLFSHEEGHIIQYLEVGHKKYQSLPLFDRERFAVDHQKEDPSWNLTPKTFQIVWENYPNTFKKSNI